MATHLVPTHLGSIDLAIVALYLIGITLFGLRFREKKSPGAPQPDRSLKSYFLANNTIPWWAIALSIVSAETSTLTIISIPGVAFAGDFGFLQIVLGYMLGRIVVALLFLPRYFAGDMLTAYQLIDQRFGPVLHKVTAALFLITRAAAEGVRVFAVSIVVGIAIGTGDTLSIGIISLLTLLYTFEGGMAAVIWTDVVQMAIYVAGTLVAVWSIGHHIGAGSAIAGWSHIHTIASAAGKFHLFNFALNLTTTYTFWAGILGGTFLTMASHGTDQLMVQRMLSARSLRESRLALLSSGVVIFIQFTLFLLIGVGLYVFYGSSTNAGAPHLASEMWAGAPIMTGLHPGMLGPRSSIAHLTPDRIFPTFIVHELPLGIAGLLVAAILAAAMSNLSAALNSLSSTTVVDFYMQLRPHAADRERNLVAKSSTGLWAIALFAIAVATVSVGGKGHVVEIALSIASVAYGCLLGVFLLGTLTRFATEIGATLGMICGFALNLWLWQGTFPKTFFRSDVLHCAAGANNAADGFSLASCTTSGLTIPHIAFTWYVLIGALVTFAIGALFSLLFRSQSKRTATTAAAALLLLFTTSTCHPEQREGPASPGSPQTRVISTGASRLHAMRSGETPVFVAAQTPGAPSVPLHGTGGYDFTTITTLLNDAIAAHKLPGAVVLIGHNHHIVFEKAYGNRKLAGEPNLDGTPTPAEPMTVDTIFDMASLTKCLATATAVMQLYEQGKIASFDDPLVKYLPEFAASNPVPSTSSANPAPSTSTANPVPSTSSANPAPSTSSANPVPSTSSANPVPSTSPANPVPGTSPANPVPGTSAGGAPLYQRRAKPYETTTGETQRAGGPTYTPAPFDRSKVTIRMLLTHTSGEAPDISLRDPWGLAAPDRPEGLRRALTTPLKAAPGSIFTYSDINFILLGDLVETLSGQREDDYALKHIFMPLQMHDTRYRPIDPCVNAYQQKAAKDSCPELPEYVLYSQRYHPIAPTAHDDESKAHPELNPRFDTLLRGVVHDPTTRRMGGVAGHAGVFSTAHDIGLYAAALLQKLRDNTGPFPLKQSTLQLMTQPEQPSTTGSTAFNSDLFTASQLRSANQAQAYAIADGTKPAAPGLAPNYPAMKGVNLRGYGWDIDTAFSKPRGAIFPIGSFGHTGFTGTSLWMDPASDTYVILLANAIHPRGNPPISNLRGQVATAAAHALGVACPTHTICDAEVTAGSTDVGLTQTPTNAVILSEGAGPHPAPQSKDPDAATPATEAQTISASASRYPEASASGLISPQKDSGLQPLGYALADSGKTVTSQQCAAAECDPLITGSQIAALPLKTLTGIDVLESTHFAALACTPGELATGKLAAGTQPPSSNLTPLRLTLRQDPPSSTCHKNLGILTNQTGLDSQGRRTIDILHALPSTVYSLLSLFTPEHGLSAQQDTTHQLAEKDASTHLPVISLYGAHEADRRPTHDQLKDLDAVLIDLQDAAGVHFWTYISAMGYFLEAASTEQTEYHHTLTIVILDRPNPVGGLAVQGPVSDPGRESYINYMSLPVRNGLTFGELARYIVATKHLSTTLTVVPMQHWQRSQFFAATGLPWINPSPNLRSPEAALRYPALGLIEYTNISVGRGTDHPFSFFGAGIPPTKPSNSTATGGLADPGSPGAMSGGPSVPLHGTGGLAAMSAWFDAPTVVSYLTARNIPGATFTPATETITEDANHYPFHGQTIEAVRLTLTDPTLADTPELGIEILSALHHLYPTQFNLARAMPLVCNKATMDALTRGDDPRSIAATWRPSLVAFRAATKPYLLY